MSEASKKENLKGLFVNPKTRLVIIVTSVVMFLFVLFAYTAFKRDDPPPALESSVSVSQGPSLSSIPGQTDNPKYAEAAANENENQFNFAEKTGGTSLPVPVQLDTSQSDLNSNNAGISDIGINREQVQVAPTTYVPPLPPVQQPVTPVYVQNNRNNLNTINQALGDQTSVLLGAWLPTGMTIEEDYTGQQNQQNQRPAQQAIQTLAANNINNQNVVQQVQQKPNNSSNKVMIKAGEIFPAILKTGVNTDEPSPVLAEIVGGEFKGATLIGAVKTANNNRAESVVLQFNTLTMPGINGSVSIQAYAINLDTSRTGLATDVDHHYFERYGLMIAAAFIGGYGQAVAESGSTVTTNPLGGTTVSTPTKTSKQIAQIALGKTGATLGQNLGQNINRPTTIEVAPGTPMGVLFMEDIKEEK